MMLIIVLCASYRGHACVIRSVGQTGRRYRPAKQRLCCLRFLPTGPPTFAATTQPDE